MISNDPRLVHRYMERVGLFRAPPLEIIQDVIEAHSHDHTAFRPASVIADGFDPTHMGSWPGAYVAEVAACVAAALATPTGCSLHIITDNMAVYHMISRLHTLWSVRHLTCPQLYRILLHESLRINITVEWTRSHSGTLGNELADRAAEFGRRLPIADRSPLAIYVSDFDPPTVRPAIIDTPPDDAEIERAVHRLQTYRAPGPGGVRPGTIKGLFSDEGSRCSSSSEITGSSGSDLSAEFCAFIRHCYETGNVPAQFLDGVMSLIPKAGHVTSDPKEMRGITVVGTPAKVLLNVLSARFMSTRLHPSQHGFVRQLSTLHAVMELKLRIRQHRIAGKRLTVAYLDVAKAYDSISRPSLLHALREQGAGENIIRLVEFCLAHERTTVKLSGRCSAPFEPSRGTRQGDPTSPSLFDFVMDLVIREFMAKRPESALPIVFADDTALTAEDPAELQADLDAFSAAMERYGMRLNHSKSVFQVFYPRWNRVTEEPYADGEHYAHRLTQPVTCTRCGTTVTRRGLDSHRKTLTCTRSALPDTVIDRRPDLTETDDDTTTAIISHAQATARFPQVRGRVFFINMPTRLGNTPTCCPLCRGTSRTYTTRPATAYSTAVRWFTGCRSSSTLHSRTCLRTPNARTAAATFSSCTNIVAPEYVPSSSAARTIERESFAHSPLSPPSSLKEPPSNE